MALFESLVLLLFVGALLLVGARRLGVPYPTLLSIAGIAVALLPFAPAVAIEPHLALALFIAPALLDAGYDTSVRALIRLWAPLLALAVGAVILTTGVVALIGWQMAGMPIAAAIALGAIVAPPDAAAAKAVLSDVGFPRRSSVVLQGESLLNDATALLIFGAATAVAMGGLADGGALRLGLAAPVGILFGTAVAFVTLRLKPYFESMLSGIIVEFTATFGTWLLAERLHLSPVLAVVAMALTLGARAAETQSARDRIQSYAVWAAAVFVLNVIAFLLMGLQSRAVIADLGRDGLGHAIRFAGLVLAAVIVVRIGSVLGYRAISGWIWRRFKPAWLVEPPRWRVSFLVSWCGMRGLLTLATAFALPQDFPDRSLIVFTAFTVVIGTLVLQGLSLKPLMRALAVTGDDGSLDEEVAEARRTMLLAGREAAIRQPEEVAAMLRTKIDAAIAVTEGEGDPQGPTPFDRGMAKTVHAQRDALLTMRREGRIADDVFQRLEEELDWLEMAARPNRELEVRET
jgi:Na+/H+ antiporter